MLCCHIHFNICITKVIFSDGMRLCSIVGHTARACAFIDIGEPIRYTLDQVAEYKKGGEERKKVLFQRSC